MPDSPERPGRAEGGAPPRVVLLPPGTLCGVCMHDLSGRLSRGACPRCGMEYGESARAGPIAEFRPSGNGASEYALALELLWYSWPFALALLQLALDVSWVKVLMTLVSLGVLNALCVFIFLSVRSAKQRRAGDSRQVGYGTRFAIVVVLLSVLAVVSVPLLLIDACFKALSPGRHSWIDGASGAGTGVNPVRLDHADVAHGGNSASHRPGARRAQWG